MFSQIILANNLPEENSMSKMIPFDRKRNPDNEKQMMNNTARACFFTDYSDLVSGNIKFKDLVTFSTLKLRIRILYF